MKKSIMALLKVFINSILFCFISCNLFAQIEVTRAIQYEQITSFEENLNISAIKMSSDGSRIVFSSSGSEVKVYTINTDGSGLTEVYNFERTGSGVFVDITADGNTVIFSDGDGEVFIANADGSGLLELATLLPNPNPDFEDIEPNIEISPRITNDGAQVLFIHSDRSPDAAGVWRVNSDGTGLVRLFSFTEFWEDGLEKTDDIFAWAGFSGGFDISGDGSRIVFGSNVLKLEISDYENGDAYVFDGEDFYHLGDYRIGDQSLATNDAGDVFMFFREELNNETNETEINLYSDNLSGVSQVKVVEGLSWPAFPAALQMSSSGDIAMAQAGGSLPYDLPISYINVDQQSHFDLVNCDDVSIALNNFRMSNSYLPSINHSGNMISFLENNSVPQIWLAKVSENAITTIPTITQVSFDPPYVTHDLSITSTISAHVTSPENEIQAVYFDALKEGTYTFRALTTEYPSRVLYDDGTHGDVNEADRIFTNDGVRRDLEETEIGTYTIRISATDGQKISVIDAEPFSILEVAPTGNEVDNLIPKNYVLNQNYPNPFNPATSISFAIPQASVVQLEVFNILGQKVETLVNDRLSAGYHTITFDASNLSSGVYLYTLHAGNFLQTRKLTLIK